MLSFQLLTSCRPHLTRDGCVAGGRSIDGGAAWLLLGIKSPAVIRVGRAGRRIVRGSSVCGTLEGGALGVIQRGRGLSIRPRYEARCQHREPAHHATVAFQGGAHPAARKPSKHDREERYPSETTKFRSETSVTPAAF